MVQGQQCVRMTNLGAEIRSSCEPREQLKHRGVARLFSITTVGAAWIPPKKRPAPDGAILIDRAWMCDEERSIAVANGRRYEAGRWWNALNNEFPTGAR